MKLYTEHLNQSFLNLGNDGLDLNAVGCWFIFRSRNVVVVDTLGFPWNVLSVYVP
jgi:hypothetical protein